MKRLSYILAILFACFAFSCGHKSGNSPVDQYVSMLEKATEKAEKISSFSELINVQEIISPEDARQIILDNRDYPLDENDKKMLKKSYDKLIRVAYEKTAEFGDLSDSMKKDSKKQIEMLIDLSNSKIDRAATFGDLLSL